MWCFTIRAFHATIKLIYRLGEFGWYAIGCGGLRFCPIKRDSKAGATCAAGEAGIILAHVSVFELLATDKQVIQGTVYFMKSYRNKKALLNKADNRVLEQ